MLSHRKSHVSAERSKAYQTLQNPGFDGIMSAILSELS
jgi:hypothetical protein